MTEHFVGRGRNKDKCTFTLNIRANSVSKSSRKVTARSGDKNKAKDAAANVSAQGSLELSTRDLYCIQTIYDQEDVFKLLVSSSLYFAP